MLVTYWQVDYIGLALWKLSALTRIDTDPEYGFAFHVYSFCQTTGSVWDKVLQKPKHALNQYVINGTVYHTARIHGSRNQG